MKQTTDEMAVAFDLPIAKFRIAEWGEMTVAHIELSAGADAAPLLEGLPDDKCPCPHWGYVIKGAVHVKYTGGDEEICRAGEVFYWPSGHTVRVEEDTSLVEFSPRQDLKHVYDHIGAKLSA